MARPDWTRLVIRRLLSDWGPHLRTGAVATLLALGVGALASSWLPLSPRGDEPVTCLSYAGWFAFYMLGGSWAVVGLLGVWVGSRLLWRLRAAGLSGPDATTATVASVSPQRVRVRADDREVELERPGEDSGSPLLEGDAVLVVGLGPSTEGAPYRDRPPTRARRLVVGSPPEIVHRLFEQTPALVQGAGLLMSVLALIVLSTLGLTAAGVFLLW